MGDKTESSFGIVPLRQVEGEWNLLVILHKHGNHWGFPKGNAEPGEAPLESATRELLEETGLKVEKLLTIEPIIEHYSFNREGSRVNKTVQYFPAIVSGVFNLQPEEIRDGRWVTFSQACNLLTFDEAKALCTHIEKLAEIQ